MRLAKSNKLSVRFATHWKPKGAGCEPYGSCGKTAGHSFYESKAT